MELWRLASRTYSKGKFLFAAFAVEKVVSLEDDLIFGEECLSAADAGDQFVVLVD